MLDEVPAIGWIVIDMNKDWNRVFAFQLTLVQHPPRNRQVFP
jgi:hypothetical protein